MTDQLSTTGLGQILAYQRLPKFSSGNIAYWLQDYKNYCKMFRVPEEEKLAEVFSLLEGEAKIWNRSQNMNTFLDWCKRAHKCFRVNGKQLSMKLDQIKIN